MSAQELERKYARLEAMERRTDESAREKAKKRPHWDENDSLKSKISKESEKIIKMKVHTEAVNWELNNKLQRSEENNEKLKSSLLQQQMECESLGIKHQSLLSSKVHINQKVENTLKLTNEMVERAKLIVDALHNMENDKKSINESFERTAKEVEEYKSNIETMGKEYSYKLSALQQTLDDKGVTIINQNERIMELNKYVNMTENIKKDLQRESQLLKANNSSLEHLIQELNEKLTNGQDKYNALVKESTQKIAELSASIVEMEKQCLSKTHEIDHLNGELLRENNQISILNNNITVLKEDIVALENKCKEQQLASEIKLRQNEKEKVKLCETIEALQGDLVNQKANHIKLAEEYLNKINTIKADIEKQKTEIEEAQKVEQNIDMQLREKTGELEIVKKSLQDMEASKQKLQEEFEMKASESNDENNKLKNENAQMKLLAESKAMDFSTKLKSLQDQVLIKSEQYNELERQHKEMCEMNKKNKEFEQKYNALVERQEVLQRELRNMRMKETKMKSVIGSPLVGSSSADKEYSNNTPKAYKVDKPQVSESSMRAPASKIPPKTTEDFCSDSDGSDCYRFDPRVIQKRFENLAKAEQSKGTQKKTNTKGKNIYLKL